MSDRITLTEVPIGAAWNVQGDASRADFSDQVARQFSIALPTVSNTTARGDALMAFWLGPRSWLLVAEAAGPPLADFDQLREARKVLCQKSYRFGGRNVDRFVHCS